MEPSLNAPELNRIYQGDCLATMRTWPDRLADCVVTSPPYFGLRDYGVAGQMGLESTPVEFVAKMVEVFQEVRRILKDDGTLWLNIGDSYAGSWGAQGHFRDSTTRTMSRQQITNHPKVARNTGSVKGMGIKPKELMMIPARLAMALQADGWYLRSDIIWHKPNPMPESITDRPTKSHEYLFLLSKSSRYYYDQAAIAEPVAMSTAADRRVQNEDYEAGRPDRGFPGQASRGGGPLVKRSGNKARKERPGAPEDHGGKQAGSVPWEGTTRNKRTVWTVSTKPFKEAHFATFPPDLIAPCILAGSRGGGVVADPFMGAGTTALVAARLGRKFIGCELNPAYIEIANRRIAPELAQGKFL